MKPVIIISISVGISIVAILGILIAFTSVSQPQVQEMSEINLDNQAELDEIERQRKINSMLNTGGSEYGDNSGNVEYWERAKLQSLEGISDQEKFELCVEEFMERSTYATSPAQEYMQEQRAQQFCS